MIQIIQKIKKNISKQVDINSVISVKSMTITALTSILETPEAYPLEQILGQQPVYMQKLIDYISTVPDPFLMNQRQCYYYPSKSVQILNTIGVYKHIVKKQEKSNKVVDVTNDKEPDQKGCDYQYPYLQRLFKNLQAIQNEEILLGYVDRLLFSVTKKTPQIYEYFKDNEQSLMTILNNDKILFAMKQFLVLFLTESTMMLYVFLKNMVLRTLMFRIVQSDSTGSVVYEMLCEFYTQLLKAYVSQTSDQDRQEIIEVLKNIQEQNFIALLTLKISPQHHRKTYFIGKILNQIASSPNQVPALVTPYVDTFTEYLEAYQQSEDFLLVIMPDQLMMLKLILKICLLQKNSVSDIKEQLVKRLLVYSNIHEKNSILHNMLFCLIEILQDQGNSKILIKAKIIEFLKNNKKTLTSFNFKGLIKRICIFYADKKLDQMVETQQEKQFIQTYAKERRQKLAESKYFKQTKNESLLLQANLSLLSEKGDKEETKASSEPSSDEK